MKPKKETVIYMIIMVIIVLAWVCYDKAKRDEDQKTGTRLELPAKRLSGSNTDP